MKKREEQIKQKFNTLSKEIEPKPKLLKNCVNAFWVGGLICVIGQLIYNFFASYGLPEEQVSGITSIILIFLGALLTGLGIYDKIASFAGGGTVVPITGFSNAIVSPAIEFKKEGFVFGVAAKMFTIAGPVLVYGVGSSVIIGVIHYIIIMIF